VANRVNYAKMLKRPDNVVSSCASFDHDSTVLKRRVIGVSFEKSKQRDQLYSDVLSRTLDSDYSPNKEPLLPKITHNIAFYKSRSRTELFKPKEAVEPPSCRYRLTMKRSTVVSLVPAKSRRRVKSLALFEQAMPSRLGMTQVLQGSIY
jgi:hypothetical protein